VKVLVQRLPGSAPHHAIAACALAAAAVRLPFLRLGLGPDEGGYAFVAEQWARGATLYRKAWVDRPQGLLVVYRLLLDVAHTAWAIRLGAVLFGTCITVLVGAIGWMLVGPRAGVASAAVYGVAGVAPHVQGFTFNGELAAALPATAAVAAAVAWRQSRRPALLLLAGACAGIAPLMKQSGFDGLVVAAAVVLLAPAPWRRRTASAGVLLGSGSLPLAASALHGWAVGWGSYWFAVVGYKLGASSGASLDVARRLARLGSSLQVAEQDLLPVATVAVVGLALALLRRTSWVPALWLLAALLGVNTASLYWAHYYVQLIAPLSLLAGIAATSTRSRLLPPLLVCAAVLPVLLFVVRLESMSRRQEVSVVPYYGQYLTDERVAQLLRTDSRPGAAIYALDSEADLYFLAGRPAAFPYLWGHPLLEIHGALAELRKLLQSPARPAWLIVYRTPDRVDPSGRLEQVVARDYRFWRRIAHTRITILRAVARPVV
jgi:4-amino-4-deoxy-L-arabinose transferase-like glycosyltransferase